MSVQYSIAGVTRSSHNIFTVPPDPQQNGRVVLGAAAAVVDGVGRVVSCLVVQLSRRREYEARGIGVNWKIRGVGYLYAKQEVVLAARVVTRVEPSDPSRERRRRRTSAAEGLSAPPPPPKPTPTHSVYIYNVYEDDVDDDVDEADGRASFRHGGLNRLRRRLNPRDDCHKLTVWVRAYGPEIIAGSAAAVPATGVADCHWRFDFAVRYLTPRRDAYTCVACL
jgi:hypothetical protein